MRIVIGGSGDVGFHLAEALADAGHSLTLIDSDGDILQHVANKIDAITLKGDISSVDLLKKADIDRADIYIAASTSESTNLLSCILAKKMGASKTIARISNVEYVEEEQKRNFVEVGVDHVFNPTLLAAKEIQRLIRKCSATDIFEFEDGKLSILGYIVEEHSKFVGKPFQALCETKDFDTRSIALLRHGKTRIPSTEEKIMANDHVYLVSNASNLSDLDVYFGEELREIKNIMIVGSTEIALQTALALEQKFNVSVIVESEHKAKKFVEHLNHALVIHGDVANLDLLKEEGLGRMDAFIALASNSETNILTSLTAESEGVFRSISLVDNAAYTQLSQRIGVDTLINKKLIAANNIFRYVRKGQVEAVASLHGVEAEIIEFVIHTNNVLTQKPLREIGMPRGALIAGVVRREKGIIPDGDFQLELDDKAIVLTLPKDLEKVENIFK